MNSNQLRLCAMAGYFIISCLVVFNIVTDKQALGILAAFIGAKEFGQQYLTPATNARTPDAAPPKTLP